MITIGRDNAGGGRINRVACGGPAATVGPEGAADIVGTVVSANDDPDYAVITFEPTKVIRSLTLT